MAETCDVRTAGSMGPGRRGTDRRQEYLDLRLSVFGLTSDWTKTAGNASTWNGVMEARERGGGGVVKTWFEK